jgi:hypothetical protein
MPVVALTPELTTKDAPNTQARALRLPDQSPLIVEAYGRDLFYAPPEDLTRLERLSTTESGLLRDMLLHALFRTIDPVHGFQPGWAFHQHYLENMAGIGVPISPNHRLSDTPGDGQAYSCQHFALDTLCSPMGNWKTIIRLSDLVRGMFKDDPHSAQERELRTLLLNDLYQQRTGRAFDPEALFCRYAITEHLGAPLGKAEYLTLEGHNLVAMPFALDVIYCRVPDNGDWKSVTVNAMPETLGSRSSTPLISSASSTPSDIWPTMTKLGQLFRKLQSKPAPETLGSTPAPSNNRPEVARLSELLRKLDHNPALPDILGGENTSALPDLAVYTGVLVGEAIEVPPRIDLTPEIDPRERRTIAQPDLVIVCPTTGPASTDLTAIARPDAPLWHYYIDRRGRITHLVHEGHVAHSESLSSGNGPTTLDQRALSVGVESGIQTMSPAQHSALIWLLRDMMQRYNLNHDKIMTPGNGTRKKHAASEKPA